MYKWADIVDHVCFDALEQLLNIVLLMMLAILLCSKTIIISHIRTILDGSEVQGIM